MNQRLPFVYGIAGKLMNTYGSGSQNDWLSGAQRIYQDQLNVLQKTYSDNAMTAARRRLGF